MNQRSLSMSNEKEQAYRYDLFISPEWREVFDELIDDSIVLPTKGRILEVNCGTGGRTVELGRRLSPNGEAVGVDPAGDRIDLARAKAQVEKLNNVTFQQAIPTDLPFLNSEFDAVIGDVSMLPTVEAEDVLDEMLRVAEPGANIVLKLSTHGSFDEFFSIYWEALLSLDLADTLWADLERLINERMTVSDAEEMARRAGLQNVESFTCKHEFRYENSDEFLESPLIEDVFLNDWLSIVPAESRSAVMNAFSAIIDRERHGGPFDLSIKATLVTGTK